MPLLRGRSSTRPRRIAAEEGIDIDKVVADRWLRCILRYMAFRAEISTRRNGGEELAITIHEMSDRDHGRLRLGRAGASVAGQAFVAAQIDLVTVDGVRDHRRLFRIVARLPLRGIACLRHRRGRALVVERGRTAEPGTERLRGERTGADCDRTEQKYQSCFPDHDCYAFSMRTAHFLKSVCSEIGSVASSVTLLMSCDSSNQGTNTRPRGGLSRPRVSRRVRMNPRREITFTSSPRRRFAANASSGCIKQTASGNAR